MNIKLTPKPRRECPKTEDISLGAALKRERLNTGWTQEKTAKNLDLLHPNYMRFERNINIPNIYKRKKNNEFLQFNFWDDGAKDLANQLLFYRIEHQLSAYNCAELIGISRNTIKRIELGVKTSSEIMNLVQNYIIKISDKPYNNHRVYLLNSQK